MRKGHFHPAGIAAAAFARNAAIAGALCCKATALEIEPLFDSDDPDIRICAAALLSAFAPALSEAAWHGVMAKCSTREALARGEFVITGEVAPPHGTDYSAMLEPAYGADGLRGVV